jgi:Rrf2 family transcriptional regulator, nitric oxide-sensitive transcriptional repressor
VRLSLYTDYSIRLLMFLAAAPATKLVNTREVATAYGISAHHLQKAVQGLARLGYVETSPGRGGGLRLGRPANEIRLGALIESIESTGCLADCSRGPCPLAGRCLLKVTLDAAERVFIKELDKVTLSDVVKQRTGAALRRLHAWPNASSRENTNL